MVFFLSDSRSQKALYYSVDAKGGKEEQGLDDTAVTLAAASVRTYSNR